jgi:hypothetical protein
MLSRRTLIGTALAVPLFGIDRAMAATSLDQYVVLLGNNTGEAQNTENGFRLRGGLYNDFASGIRLFSQFTLPASGTIRYRLTREIIPPTVTSNGVWLNVGIVWGLDPTTLPPDTPTSDTETAPMWKGWRITHANKALDSTVSNRIRLSTYPNRTQLAPREAKVLANFKANVAYDVVLTWSGRVVSLAVPTMGTSIKQSWANDTLRVPSTGGPRLMWYGSFGGQWLIENVTLPS